MRPLLTAAAMAGVLAVAACEGENLFTNPGGGGAGGLDGTAPTVDISTPRGDSLSGVALTDSVFVSAHLTDRVGVRSVRLYGFSKRGDANLGTQEIVPRFTEKTVELRVGLQDTTLARYLVSTGDTVRGTAYVVVEARDSAGNLAADTASLWVGGPTVQIPGLVENAVVSSGGALAATIKASDPKGVNRLTLEVTGSIEREVVKTLGTSQVTTQLDTSVAIPDTAAGPITVRASGRNTLGIVERSPGLRLFIADRMAPVAVIQLPRGDSLSAKPIGDSVLVTARITDNFGVRSIRMQGIAQRGNRDLGTDTVVTRFVERAITLPAGVKDTTISRYLRATPDSTKETAQIIVVAADSAGNQSSDTVNLVLGGPDVEILDIVDGQSIQAGLNLATRVRVQDPQGITQVRIVVTGAFDTTVVKNITPPADSLVVDTVIAIPDAAIGPMQISAVARNSLDVAGQDGPLTMLVIATGVGDTIAPVLKHASEAPDRMEIQDSVTVQVTGSDQGGGVAKVGYTVRAISPTRGDTLIRTDSASFDPPRTGTVTKFFKFGTFNVDSLALPDTLVYEITTWMKDAQGNCAAAVGADTVVALTCATLPGGQIVAQNRVGQRLTRSVVAGKTIRLPRGGTIMDAAVDTAQGRRRLFLSNIQTNRVDVFRLEDEIFEPAIGVGSEPWGLAINRRGDSLWVANSGGTNLSSIHINNPSQGLTESDSVRLLTPDVNIFEVKVEVGEASILWNVLVLPAAATGVAFSDRPQYVAVDSLGNVIYSTKTTAAGLGGTVRKGYFVAGSDTAEVKIFNGFQDVTFTEDVWTVFHVDSVAGAADGNLKIWDHPAGSPGVVIEGSVGGDDVSTWGTAIEALRNAGSDIEVWTGTIDPEDFLLKDTTFVAASGDGSYVVVGEGASAPLGRVMTYKSHAGDTVALTARTRVIDLLTNAAEEVRGIGVNNDGTSAVIRGREAAYFISPEDLRLQGVVSIASATQAAGAALHPLHANVRNLENLGGRYSPDTHLAFVSSGDRTIDIIDTWRFTRIGRLYLRDRVVGPLRAVLPFGSENQGLNCGSVPVYNRHGAFIGDAVQLYAGGSFTQPLLGNGTTDDRCVVMKLFGVTSAGGVVVVDVRKVDIFREHPNKP